MNASNDWNLLKIEREKCPLNCNFEVADCYRARFYTEPFFCFPQGLNINLPITKSLEQYCENGFAKHMPMKNDWKDLLIFTLLFLLLILFIVGWILLFRKAKICQEKLERLESHRISDPLKNLDSSNDQFENIPLN